MIPVINILRSDVDDLDGILEIESRSFKLPWSRQMFLDDINSKYGYVYTAKSADEGGKILGYICFSLIVDELHILNFAVDVPFRRNKVATRLLDYAIDIAKKNGATIAFLEVRESNKGVIELYKKAGFFEIAKRKKYYADNGEDAIIMINHLYGDL